MLDILVIALWLTTGHKQTSRYKITFHGTQVEKSPTKRVQAVRTSGPINSQSCRGNAKMLQDTSTEPRPPPHEAKPLSTAPRAARLEPFADVLVGAHEPCRRNSMVNSGTPWSLGLTTWQKSSSFLC